LKKRGTTADRGEEGECPDKRKEKEKAKHEKITKSVNIGSLRGNHGGMEPIIPRTTQKKQGAWGRGEGRLKETGLEFRVTIQKKKGRREKRR